MSENDNGLILKVKVVPNSSKNEVVNTDGEIRIKITAQPVDGKANKALIEFLSKTFKISKSSFKITKGATSKEKTIFVNCKDEEKLQKLKDFLNLGN